MAMPPVTDENAIRALAAYREAGNFTAGARALDMDRKTFRRWVQLAEDRGLTLSDGARDSVHRASLDYGEARGGHRRVYDDDGKQIDTIRWAKTPVDYAVEMAERVADVFQCIPAAPPVIKSDKSPEGKFRFIPHTDVHIGAVASDDRVGQELSPSLAGERVKQGFAECSSALPEAEETVILNNGDLTHANDDKDATPRSGHRLKIEGSHRDNIDLCIYLTVWQIDHALKTSDLVRYRPNAGNHDPNTPDYLTAALRAWYRNEPRVIIEDTQRKTWVFQRGAVFIATHHGDGIKPREFCANLPGKFAAEFGASRFWYAFTGHYHTEKQETFGHIRWSQLPPVCSLDQHADDMGFGDSAAMRGILFCDRGGLKNDVTVRF